MSVDFIFHYYYYFFTTLVVVRRGHPSVGVVKCLRHFVSFARCLVLNLI